MQNKPSNHYRIKELMDEQWNKIGVYNAQVISGWEVLYKSTPTHHTLNEPQVPYALRWRAGSKVRAPRRPSIKRRASPSAKHG